jgi:hypothetical protein
MTSDKCKLCNLESIGEEHFKDDDITIVSHILDGSRVFMAVPLDYVDPRTKRHNELREKMEAQLFQAYYQFNLDLDFHIHWSCPYSNPIDLAGVKEPSCRLCAATHRLSHNSCGHGHIERKRILAQNEAVLQKLKKIGIIE